MAPLAVQVHRIAVLLLIGMHLVICAYLPPPVYPSSDLQARLENTRQQPSKASSNLKGLIQHKTVLKHRKTHELQAGQSSRLRRVLRRDLHRIGQVFLPGMIGPQSFLDKHLQKRKRDRRARSLSNQGSAAVEDLRFPTFPERAAETGAKPSNELDGNSALSPSGQSEIFKPEVDYFDLNPSTSEHAQTLSSENLTLSQDASSPPSIENSWTDSVNQSDVDLGEQTVVADAHSSRNRTSSRQTQLQLLLDYLMRWNGSAASVRDFEVSLRGDPSGRAGNSSRSLGEPRLRYSFVRRWLRKLYRRTRNARRGGPVKRNSGSKPVAFKDLLKQLMKEVSTPEPPNSGSRRRNGKKSRGRKGRRRNRNRRPQSNVLDGLNSLENGEIATLPKTSVGQSSAQKIGGVTHKDPFQLLYISRSGMFLRIATDGEIRGVYQADVYCVISFVSVDQQGDVILKIKAAKTGLFLALDGTGHLYSTLNPYDRNTSFAHKFDVNLFDAYMSLHHRSYIAFRSNGEPYSSRVTSLKNTKAHFLTWNVSDAIKRELRNHATPHPVPSPTERPATEAPSTNRNAVSSSTTPGGRKYSTSTPSLSVTAETLQTTSEANQESPAPGDPESAPAKRKGKKCGKSKCKKGRKCLRRCKTKKCRKKCKRRRERKRQTRSVADVMSRASRFSSSSSADDKIRTLRSVGDWAGKDAANSGLTYLMSRLRLWRRKLESLRVSHSDPT